MNAAEFIQQAIACHAKGEHAAALETCERALRLEPRNAEAHHLLGCARLAQGDQSAAIVSISMAISIAPKQARYVNNLGTCYLLKDEFFAAELCFRQALALHADYPDALANLGVTLFKQKRLDEAAPVLSHCLDLAPQHVNALCNLAAVLAESGDNARAIAVYDKVLALEPEHASAMVRKAGCLYHLGDIAQGLAILERAPMVDALRTVEVMQLKASLLGVEGRIDEACDALDIGIAAEPGAIEQTCARAALRKIRRDEGFFSHIRRFEGTLHTIHGNARTEICYALGKAYQDVGDIATAAKYYAQGAANHMQMKDFDEAGEVALYEVLKRNVTRGYIESLRGQGNESKRPIFIVGMERSGTTLTEQILASHPDVFAGGELPFFPEAVDRYVFPDGTQVLRTGSSGFDSNSRLQERGQCYLDRLAGLAGNQGKRFVTDKLPGNFLNIGLILAVFPNARIIHCRRDPIDNCISSYVTPFSQGMAWSYELGALGRHFRRYWDMMAHWRREFPGQFLELRYEQTVADTERAARTLLEWCGLAWDPVVLRFYETARPVKTASVTQVRKPIYTSSMGRWKPWEPYIAPLLAEIGDLEQAYWDEEASAKS
jgi:tetratricopeptide (TPR) repeat protein